jgi:hypothetical protein
MTGCRGTKNGQVSGWRTAKSVESHLKHADFQCILAVFAVELMVGMQEMRREFGLGFQFGRDVVCRRLGFGEGFGVSQK